MYKIWLFCQLIFFVSFFSLSEARLKLSVLYLLGHVTVGSFFLSVTWYITYDTGNERWQVTESGKLCVWVPTDLCFSCSPSVFTYFFFSWWARTFWFIVNTGVPQQLVERGWLLGQMQFKYSVPQTRLFFSGLKILLSNFSKKTTAEFDLGFHSIYFLSFLLLHLVSTELSVSVFTHKRGLTVFVVLTH